MADDYDPASPTFEIDGNNAGKHIPLGKENFMKPEKVKSRWRRNSEMETQESSLEAPLNTLKCSSDSKDMSLKSKSFPMFEILEENLYLFERKRTKRKKEVRRMLCECSVTTENNETTGIGCKDECLNRLLMIECGSRCATGDACSNRRFQKREYAKTEPFKTEKKGFGLRVTEDVTRGSFIIEYIGEVLNSSQFKQRVKQYAREKEQHYYFMSLKSDEIIDARNKGNASRFINHSCDPNCETQKWTVNGELRIGFFAKHDIKAGEELTFDYQFQRYGRQAQNCYCGSENCNGFIGVTDEITMDLDTGKKENKNKRKKLSDKEEKRREERILEDVMLEEEIQKLCVNGLRNKDETLMLSRLMVRAEDSYSREKLLDIILGTTEVACLRLFLDYHGLTLLWSWMAYLNDIKLKTKILEALSLLPVPNKTLLLDSKVLSVVEKWASMCVVLDEREKIKDVGSVNNSFDKDIVKKVKPCDTSDSETDCDVTMPKIVHSAVKSTENNIAVLSDEEPSNDKTSDINAQSDEESGDTPEEKDIKCNKIESTKIANLAQSLLTSWKDLKEVFRIPRREKRDEKDCENKRDGSEILCNGKPSETSNKHIEGKNQNTRDTKGNNDERGSFSNDEKPQEIKVVCIDHFPRKYSHSSSRLSKEEKRSLFAVKMQQRERRKNMQKNVVYPVSTQYNGSDYNSNENYQFPPPPANNLHYNQYFYNTLYNAPRPPAICTGPPPAAETTPSPVFTPNVPNVLFPPPSQNFKMPPPFLGLPPPTVTPEPVTTVAPCENSSLPPPSHLINMTGVSSPIVPMQVSAASSGSGSYIQTQNEFLCDHKPVMYMPPTLPTSQQPEQTYPFVQENGEQSTRAVPVKLPPNWKTATDSDGQIYFYHVITRETTWDPPGLEKTAADVDNGTPTYDEPKEHKHETHSRRSHKKHSKRKSTTTAPADTSSNQINGEIAKKIKELFRTKMSSFVVQCLNPYRKEDCRVGRITSNEDFKHLARKLTHFVMAKELKHCKNVEDLDANDGVKFKARDYIHKYMARYGPLYRKEKCVSLEDD